MVLRWLARRQSDASIERQAIVWVARMSNDPEGHRAALERWLARDSRRRPVYARISDDLEIYSEAARTLERPPVQAPRPRPSLPPVALAAVFVALAIGAALLFAQVRSDKEGEQVADAMFGPTEVELVTGVGEVRTFRLEDQSTVTLDSGSTLAVSISATQRELWLHRGRVRFEVAHDPVRPFVVHTAGGTVTARGTVFDVWLRPDRTVKVVLIEGAVDVVPPKAAAAAKPALPQRLEAGQRLLYSQDDAQKPLSLPSPASDAETGWVNGVIDFDHVPLGEVVLEANRYAVVPIILADPELADIKVFGTFRIQDTRKLATKLAASLDLTLEERTDAFVLSSSKRDQK